MKNWTSHFVKANGIQLHYTRTGGADKPKLLLAHGFSDAGLCWTPVAAKLAAQYDIVMLDARGHGRSEAPERGYGSGDHAADIAAVIKALKWRKPLLLGHSMGALSAMATAGTYPGLLGGILLEDPPPWWIALPKPNPVMRDRIRMIKRSTREEIVALLARDNPHWQVAERAPWIDAKQRMSFEAIAALSAKPLNWNKTIRAITCPILLIHGDGPRGSLVTAQTAAAFSSLQPSAQVAYVPDASHNIRRDQFAAYMRAVSGFLKSL